MIKLNERIDKEYLQREALDNIRYNISEKHIKVESNCTLFVNISKYEKIESKQELLKKRAKAIKLAKAKGVSISYQHKTKKTINELWNSYETDIKTGDRLYNQIKKGWLDIKEHRGIRMGFSDDQYIDHLSKLKWNHESLSNTSEPIYKITNILNKVNDIVEDLQNQTEDDNYKISKIYL